MREEFIVMRPDDSTLRRPLHNPDHSKELVEAVGGIELVPGITSYNGKFCDAYVNQESVLDGLPKNQAATELWWAQLDSAMLSTSCGARWRL